jgi:hypothetical protein
MKRRRLFASGEDDGAAARAPTLPPMPLRPSRPGPLGAVLYLWPVGLAHVSRWLEERRVRRELFHDQRRLDDVLAELGRAARQEARHVPELEQLAQEMNLLDRTEERRDRAGSELRDTITRGGQEVERLGAIEAERSGAVERQNTEAMQLKGKERAAALAELARRRRALVETVDERRRALKALDTELGRLQAEGRGAAAEHQRRLEHVGTLLNLNRVAHPRLDPLYDRIDGLKHVLAGRDATIARLQVEREAHDHAAVHQGLIALALVAGALVLVALALVVVLG